MSSLVPLKPVTSTNELSTPSDPTIVEFFDLTHTYTYIKASKELDCDNLPLQPISQEVWSDKYAIHSTSNNSDNSYHERSVSDMNTRLAKAFASVENNKEWWTQQFLMALELGAIPAGRICSNLGAEQYKPNTSTINCTVSSSITDSMDNILFNVHMAGLTLKAGCGIGYEFSLLRPRGATVAGVGSATNGPLAFMDIFDTMCLTISSAGGRRGAQMGTFSIYHPDVLDFINAKRQNGRLRHFNLSVLITDDFMEAVKNDSTWKLSFPLSRSELFTHVDPELWTTDQLVFPTIWREHPVKDNNYIYNDKNQCLQKVYKELPAREIWDAIMKSTYDYAEPGFILIDRVNKYNNNYFCENIRATNPCVTGDTPIITKEGEKPISELVDQEIECWNGYEWSKVTPKVTGINEPITSVLVELREDNNNNNKSSISILRCTNYHKWIIKDGSRIATTELMEGDELMSWKTTTGTTVTGVVNKIYRDVFIADKVYCFTDRLNHSGVFNQIMTGNCGEQPLPPNGSCLLGSINLTKFVVHPYESTAYFDMGGFAKVVRVFTRMLDNVVEQNGLPLKEQRDEILRKRRHGMGFTGLGSALTLLGIEYGSHDSFVLAETIAYTLAKEGWKTGVKLAEEKGCAPICNEQFGNSNKSGKELLGESQYFSAFLLSPRPDIDSELKDNMGLITDIKTKGVRFTHHSSIAPTGTISLSIANNVSNGIEPTFQHQYTRNIIKPNHPSKIAETVNSYEWLVWLNYCAIHGLDPVEASKNQPALHRCTDNVSVDSHLQMQSVVQKWVDSSISKTINVPENIDFETFKLVYLKAYDLGLKGCTTFRFNPEVFSGVLVRPEDLAATTYCFTLDNGEKVVLTGDQLVEYEGCQHTAANLHDAIKEGYYGRH